MTLKTSLKNPKGFLKEHYVYEINMLRQTFLHHQRNPDNAIIKNALYVSFCVHARALWDFFSKINPNNDDVIAKHFASNWDPATSKTSQLGVPEREAINKQVAHLTEKRENAVRIDATLMQKIHDALVDDNENFQKQVDQLYQSCFAEDIKAATIVHIPSQIGQANVAINSSSVTQSS
jgi:hypothetical protein